VKPVSPEYDGSDIAVETSCSDDTVFAKIKNIDCPNSMTSLGFIYVIEDEIVVKTDSFMLPPGSFIINKYYAEADKTLTWKCIRMRIILKTHYCYP